MAKMEKILVADDERQILDSISDNLKEKYSVLVFSNPGELINQLIDDSSGVEAVILDIDYKTGMSGTDALKIIKSKFNNINNVILMSATTYGDSIFEFAKENKAKFIEKPFKPEDLIKLINENSA